MGMKELLSARPAFNCSPFNNAATLGNPLRRNVAAEVGAVAMDFQGIGESPGVNGSTRSVGRQ